MRFCQPHWDALRAAITARGLDHLIAANGREAIARVKSELEGTDDVSDFDPLMSAHWMIVSHVQQLVGLALFAGDLCPVCEILKVYPPIPEGHQYASNESYFIDGPADAVLETARELGIDKPFTPGLGGGPT